MLKTVIKYFLLIIFMTPIAFNTNAYNKMDKQYHSFFSKDESCDDSEIKHFIENDFFRCSNETKKISFYLSTNEMSGNGYFFLNFKEEEAYMPNEVFQQLFSQINKGQIVIDQFIRNGKMENYVITGGQKIRVSQNIGINMSAVIKNDAINAKRFKNDFKKTGKTRKYLQTSNLEIEYIGKDDEGRPLNVWIVPSNDVCLPKGKFDMHGFYNIGYISIDGTTYLITEMSGSGLQIKLTDISDSTYHFNSAGYQTMSLPGL